MSESAIKSNEVEAARLYERGVAAARSGQRRIAAGLLARTVQLNPRHELGWLWLSGVLDDPEEIAFCLRSVLTVNPHNERAQQGLAWLEQQGRIKTQPPALAAAVAPPAAADETPARHHERDSWWVRWRHERREMSRARLVFWTVPILLLLLTLGLNILLRDAISRNTALAQAAAQPEPAAVQRPALPPILQLELPATGDAGALAYLSALDAPRARLREAVQRYRESTSQPGGSSVAHATAARKLREEIDAQYQAIAAQDPPAGLAAAHNSYLAGLEIERQALDDMLEFYNSFRVQFANRATLRMVDAERQFTLARALLETRRATATRQAVPSQTMR